MMNKGRRIIMEDKKNDTELTEEMEKELSDGKGEE